MAYTTIQWARWGLCIVDGAPNWEEATRCHNLVTGYLATHPDAAAQYKTDQSGAVKYLDVLAVAESQRRLNDLHNREIDRHLSPPVVRPLCGFYREGLGTCPQDKGHPGGHSFVAHPPVQPPEPGVD